VLGRALTAVLRDGAPETTLSDYATIRRQAAEEVLVLASRLTRLATMGRAPVRAARNLVLRTLNHVRPFKHKLALNLSGLARKNLSELPGAELGCPKIEVRQLRLEACPALAS
jgi:2-polyprenyl-6-methoxyphenol hydroxylase-like FAD-dependent oxidoreductase